MQYQKIKKFTIVSQFLFIAFDSLPRLIKPKEDSQLFEYRIYEGYSEDAVKRKVDMFNEEELKIFKNTGLHSVFLANRFLDPPCHH